MNLMFRKNFRDQKSCALVGKGVKSSVGRHTSKRTNREQGYTAMEEHQYRTHLFFSPPRCSYSPEEEDESADSRKISMMSTIPYMRHAFTGSLGPISISYLSDEPLLLPSIRQNLCQANPFHIHTP